MRMKWLCVCLCFFLVACQAPKQEVEVYDPFSNTETVASEYLVNLDYDTLVSMMDSDKTFVLYIGRPDCGDCREFEPLLATYLNETGHFPVYYLNVKEFRDAARKEDASDEEIAFYDNLRERLHFSWTPTMQKRQGDTILSEYTYLSEAYYALSDQTEKDQAKQQAITDFENWMKEAGTDANL